MPAAASSAAAPAVAPAVAAPAVAAPAVAAPAGAAPLHPHPHHHRRRVIDYDNIQFDQVSQSAFVLAVPLGSLLVRSMFYPITLVKTRIQTQSSPSSSPSPSPSSPSATLYRGTWHGLRTIVREEGVRALYSGFGVNLVSMFAGPVYLTSFEHSRLFLQRYVDRLQEREREHAQRAQTTNAPPHRLQPFVPAVAGLCGSLVGQLIVVPLEVISQRIMVQRGASSSGQLGSAKNMAQRTIAKHGWRGLYRGYVLAVVSAAPFSSLTWGIYMPTAAYLRSVFGHQWTPEELATRGPWTGFVRDILFTPPAAILGCSVAVFITQPIDVVKTRLQVGNDMRSAAAAAKSSSSSSASSSSSTPASPPSSTTPSSSSTSHPKPTAWTVARDLLRERGVRGLYIGLGSRLLATAPAMAILVTMYETLKRACVIAPVANDDAEGVDGPNVAPVAASVL